jgi:hypothetical protein
MAKFTRDDDSSGILDCKISCKKLRDAQLPVQGTPQPSYSRKQLSLVKLGAKPVRLQGLQEYDKKAYTCLVQSVEKDLKGPWSLISR